MEGGANGADPDAVDQWMAPLARKGVEDDATKEGDGGGTCDKPCREPGSGIVVIVVEVVVEDVEVGEGAVAPRSLVFNAADADESEAKRCCTREKGGEVVCGALSPPVRVKS